MIRSGDLAPAERAGYNWYGSFCRKVARTARRRGVKVVKKNGANNYPDWFLGEMMACRGAPKPEILTIGGQGPVAGVWIHWKEGSTVSDRMATWVKIHKQVLEGLENGKTEQAGNGSEGAGIFGHGDSGTAQPAHAGTDGRDRPAALANSTSIDP